MSGNNEGERDSRRAGDDDNQVGSIQYFNSAHFNNLHDRSLLDFKSNIACLICFERGLINCTCLNLPTSSDYLFFDTYLNKYIPSFVCSASEQVDEFPDLSPNNRLASKREDFQLNNQINLMCLNYDFQSNPQTNFPHTPPSSPTYSDPPPSYHEIDPLAGQQQLPAGSSDNNNDDNGYQSESSIDEDYDENHDEFSHGFS